MAQVNIIQKVSEKGHVYQVLRITFANGEMVELFLEPREMNKVLLAMINRKED